MTSVLSTSTGALLAFQRALATVSHNVANINTEGYSRQKVDFATRTPDDSGNYSMGTGVTVANVRRVADQLATTRLLDASGELARLDQLSSLADRVDALFSDSATNVASLWSAFFDAASGLSSNASSSANRRELLDSANSLTSRFAQLAANLDSLGTEVNDGLTGAAAEINRLTAAIAQANNAIGRDTTKAPADLLDSRDQLIKELVSYTGGTAIIQDGGMNVYTAGGQALVVGSTASKVTTVADPYQPQNLQLALQTQGLTVTLGSNAFGGRVGGLLEFRQSVLTPAQNELGRLAIGLADSFNTSHGQGMDLYGQLGTNFFAVTGPVVSANNANTGAAILTPSLSDISKLDGQNVVLRYDGTNWTATRADDGAAVALTGQGTAADPLVVNGVSLQVAGTANANDRFLLQPTARAAATLSTVIHDPSRIAAASPVQAKASLNNTGTGVLAKLGVTDAANAALLNASTIEFIDSTQYTVDGAGPFAYTYGQQISANGWSLTLDGNPAAGDTFTVTPRAAGSGDNGNALAMADVENVKAFANGTVTLNSALAGLTTQVGSAARAADYALQAQQVINDNAQGARDSIAGVNLDEEAADMLRLQQAYQAASQLISTADTMFQSILSAVR